MGQQEAGRSGAAWRKRAQSEPQWHRRTAKPQQLTTPDGEEWQPPSV